jgi:chromosome segregation ATPase
MGKLGKIFGILVLVLAIVVAVFSFLLSKHRDMFKNRAADLADGVVKTAQTLSSGSGQGNPVAFTPASGGGKESGNLGWGDYKANPSDYKNKIDQVVKLAQSVSDQRTALSESLANIAATLKAPEDLGITADNLKNLGKYSAAAKALSDHVEEVQKRDEEVRASLEALSSLLKATANGFADSEFYTRKTADGSAPKPAKKPAKKSEDDEEEEEAAEDESDKGATQYGGYDVQTALQTLDQAAKVTVARTDAYKKGYEDMIGAISKYKWNVTASDLAGKDYKNALAAMVADAKEINTKIGDLEEQVAKLKREVEDFKTKLADREDQIAKLKDDLAKMTAERDQLKKQAELLSMPKSEYKDANAPVEAIEKMEEVKIEISGKVLEVNEEWNFITLDLGKDKVVPNLRMAVNQNGAYIATVKITKVEDRVCCAEVVTGRVADIKPGAVVFYSGTNKVGKED